MKYRIIRDSYNGYEVQENNGSTGWKQSGNVNSFVFKWTAKRFIRDLKEGKLHPRKSAGEVVWTDEDPE